MRDINEGLADWNILQDVTRLGIRFAFVLIGLLILPALIHAEPFLVCDPYPQSSGQPTEFRIVSGQLSFSVPAHKLPDGSVILRFDTARLPDGEHTLAISAVDTRNGTESSAAPVTLLKAGKEVKLEQVKEKLAPTRSLRPPSSKLRTN